MSCLIVVSLRGDPERNQTRRTNKSLLSESKKKSMFNEQLMLESRLECDNKIRYDFIATYFNTLRASCACAVGLFNQT